MLAQVKLEGFSPLSPESNSFGPIAGLALLLALASSFFWMFVAWRAMRAHERLASAAQSIATDQARLRR